MDDPPTDADPITPDILLNAYASGYFPMADHRGDQDLFWVDPDLRGILPLDGFHLPRSLKKRVRQAPYRVTLDSQFSGVMQACAASQKNRTQTWISTRIERLYCALHRLGFAHSIECWKGDELVGGLYGVSLRGAFFGESMFHTATDASKIALVYLVALLRRSGFSLLDTQFTTDHLEQFGVIEIPRQEYRARLRDALIDDDQKSGNWSSGPVKLSPDAVLQASTQTS